MIASAIPGLLGGERRLVLQGAQRAVDPHPWGAPALICRSEPSRSASIEESIEVRDVHDHQCTGRVGNCRRKFE